MQMRQSQISGIRKPSFRYHDVQNEDGTPSLGKGLFSCTEESVEPGALANDGLTWQ